MGYITTTNRTERYEENAAGPETVAAFDTDYTMVYADGWVPLWHIIELRNDPTVSVWSTGYNQSLRSRAEIPGMEELKDRLPVGREFITRPDRMRLLERLYPDADRYIVVDDVDLSELEPDWEYHPPWDYAADTLGLEVDLNGHPGVPRSERRVHTNESVEAFLEE